MTQVNKMGTNRTGMDMSPIDGKDMLEGARKLTKSTPLSEQQIVNFRELAINASGSVGSVPIPGTFKGALSVAKEKLQGYNPEVLINKLGQRLAFERAGTRLYDALIIKCEALLDRRTEEIVSLELLRQFRNEEHEHALLVESVISEMGADATAMTSDANVSAVASMGLPKVITEPRTTVSQCLEAIQIAELADNAAWSDLQQLCSNMGLNDLADRFDRPIEQEKVHQDTIAGWIKQLLLEKASA